MMSGCYNITEHSSAVNYFHTCDDYRVMVLLWFSCNIVIGLFGFPPTVVVLFELFQKYKQGIPTTPNDVFMLNLTVMDALFLFCLPIGACNYVNWKIWEVECVFNFLYSFTMGGRPLFMTCICLDCYLAVVHPILYRARKGLTSRVLMSIFVWAVTVIHGSIYLNNHMDSTWSTVAILPSAFTILTVGICDFFILRALKSSDPAGRDLHPQKKKARHIINNSLVMTAIAYMPQLLLFFLGLTLPLSTEVYQCVVTVPFLILTSSSGVAMSLLYLSNTGKLDLLWLWCSKTT